MSRKRITAIVAIVAVAVLAFLVVRSCQLHTDSLYGLKVVGDGNGSAIALYEDKLGGNIYAQKVSPDGKPAWGEKGMLLGSSDDKAYSFFDFDIISDGSGRAIVAWPEHPQKFRPSRNLARIDSDGNMVWQHDFIYFNRLISDGFGGAIIAFDYSPGEVTPDNSQEDLGLMRVDDQGGYTWGVQGPIVPRGNYQDNTLQMAPDGSGGVIVVWEELQYPPEAAPGEAVSTGRLLTQKVNGEGELEWGDGVLIYTTPENTYAESPQIISDGSGGSLVIWQQMYSGRIEGGSPEAEKMDILVQKLDAGGNVMWKGNGLPLEINKNAGNAFPTQPLTVSDGSGGAIVIWRDSRDKTGVYAQKVDTDGTMSWQAGGIKVASTSLNPFPMIISDGAGGAIISYSLQGGLYVQKVNINGETAWSENGIQVIEGEYQGYSIATDGQGGVIVGWGVGKGMFSSEKAYIQKVNADGRLLWGEKGIKLK